MGAVRAPRKLGLLSHHRSELQLVPRPRKIFFEIKVSVCDPFLFNTEKVTGLMAFKKIYRTYISLGLKELSATDITHR